MQWSHFHLRGWGSNFGKHQERFMEVDRNCYEFFCVCERPVVVSKCRYNTIFEPMFLGIMQDQTHKLEF